MPTCRLLSCPACAGFVPGGRASCPHCDAAMASGSSWTVRLARRLASMIGGGAFAITLMACYGAMPRHGEYADGRDCQSDADQDGSCAPQDCNDGDPLVFPGTQDPDLDGIDQNCDGVDGWRDPATVAEPTPVAPEPTPVATEPPP